MSTNRLHRSRILSVRQPSAIFKTNREHAPPGRPGRHRTYRSIPSQPIWQFLCNRRTHEAHFHLFHTDCSRCDVSFRNLLASGIANPDSSRKRRAGRTTSDFKRVPELPFSQRSRRHTRARSGCAIQECRYTSAVCNVTLESHAGNAL